MKEANQLIWKRGLLKANTKKKKKKTHTQKNKTPYKKKAFKVFYIPL